MLEAPTAIWDLVNLTAIFLGFHRMLYLFPQTDTKGQAGGECTVLCIHTTASPY